MKTKLIVLGDVTVETKSIVTPVRPDAHFLFVLP